MKHRPGPNTLYLDTETELFNTGNVIPRLVVATVALGDGEPHLYKTEDDELFEILAESLENPEIHFVGCSVSYDFAVLFRRFPELVPLIWQAYADGRVHDVLLIDKLLCISTHGDLEFLTTPNGAKIRLDFSLAGMAQRHLGRDRSAEKKSAEGWRMRYAELMGVAIKDWPVEAAKYATDDVRDTRDLFKHLSTKVVGGRGQPRSAETESFQAAVDFSLRLATAWGIETDQDRVAHFRAKLHEILSPEKMRPLYGAGLVRPAEPGRVKNKAGDLTKGKPETLNQLALRDYVAAACQRYGMPIARTPGGEVSTNSDVIGQLVHRGDGLMKVFQSRAEHRTLLTTFLPVLESPLVHFNFDVLKTTGRTSSYGGDAYASTNGQNQPRIGGELSVRECFVARPGRVLFSIDYQGIELCSVAQITYSLFKRSRHRELINAGYDLHAFLGSRLAALFCREFSAASRGFSDEARYQLFRAWKTAADEQRKLYKHYRTFAKPTGLGYPGGLGPATFVTYARDTYGVNVSEAEARQMRDIWHETYPEMREFFEWVNEQHDPLNVGSLCYVTPAGMYRANCMFTEAANGRGMQSPSAEGGKSALFEAAREMYDPTRESILYGSRLISFIHDELFGDMAKDDKMHDRCLAIGEIMVTCMRRVFPDVTVKAEPTLMLRWYKDAEAVYDQQGKLTIWEPRRT